MKPDYNSAYGRGNVVIHRLQCLSEETHKRKGEGYRRFSQLGTSIARLAAGAHINERRFR